MLNKNVILGRIERQETELAKSMMEKRLQNRSSDDLDGKKTVPKPTPRVHSLIEELKKKQR